MGKNIEVSTTDPVPVSWAPDLIQEIRQNIFTILRTPKGSIPLQRDFGLSPDINDKPLPVAQMLLQAEVIEAIQRYEPRVKVTKVVVTPGKEQALNGRMDITVQAEVLV